MEDKEKTSSITFSAKPTLATCTPFAGNADHSFSMTHSIWFTHMLQAGSTRFFTCAFHFGLHVCFSLDAASKSEGKYISCSFLYFICVVVLKFLFQTLYLEKICKNYTKHSYTSHPTSSNVNVLHNHSVAMNNRKLTSVYYSI